MNSLYVFAYCSSRLFSIFYQTIYLRLKFIGWKQALIVCNLMCLKVVFTNEQTGEYQFFEVTFRAVRPGVMANIDLVTPVRQSVPYTIMLENPLNYAVTFNATCSIPEILMPNQLAVPAQSEVSGKLLLLGPRMKIRVPYRLDEPKYVWPRPGLSLAQSSAGAEHLSASALQSRASLVQSCARPVQSWTSPGQSIACPVQSIACPMQWSASTEQSSTSAVKCKCSKVQVQSSSML